VRDPALIKQRTDYLKIMYGPRNEQYQINRWAYDGEFDKIGAYGSVPIGWGGLDNRRRRTSAIQNWNVMKPLVDFTVIQLSRLPTISVPTPIAGDSAAKAKATIVENYLYWLWDQSFMDTRHMEIGWNIGCLGSAAHQLVPDFERGCCYFRERDPGHCYPMPRGDGQTFEYVSWCWTEDAELLACRYPKLRDRFPRKGNRFARMVEVIEYQDDDDYGFLIDGEYIDQLAGYTHKLGFVPVTVTPAIRRPGAGNIFGPADIDQLVGTNMLLNTLQTKIYDALEENLYPSIFTIGDEEVLIDRAPGSHNYLGPPGSDVKQLNPPSIPQEAWAEYDRFMGHIRTHGNWSEANSGMLEQSQASGQAIRRLQSPASGLAGIRQSLLAQDMKQMNVYWLRMQEHFFGHKKYDCTSDGNVGALRAPGRSSTPFEVPVTPLDDIAGYHRNDVSYSIFGADINSTLVSVQQLGQNGYISKEFGMRLIPGITDEKAMKEEIKAERREDIEFEAELQTRLKEIETNAYIKQQQAAVEAEGQMAAMRQGQGAPGAGAGGGGGGGPLNNVAVLPQGQPQVMSVGGALSSDSGQVGGLPVTELKPFGQALQSLGAPAQGQTSPQGAPAAAPEETNEADRITAEEVIAAIQAITGQIKGGKIRSRSGGFKGDIYLMGELAQRGGTTDTIDIGYTVPADWQLITNALTEWRGRLAGHSLTEAPAVGIPVVKGGQNVVSEATQAA
jgi:hypothetical protein